MLIQTSTSFVFNLLKTHRLENLLFLLQRIVFNLNSDKFL